MKIYNTLTRQKEELVTLEPGVARIYACGPTVYNYIHIGNARPHLRVRRAAPVPGMAGLRGEIRPELHRHRRQDHPPGQ